MAEKVGFSSVIKNPGFRYLWFNQILVQLALNALNFTLIIWVFKLANNNLSISALMLAVYLPAVIFGIFAGVFVDIFDRKKIILLIDFLIALSFILFIFIKGSFVLVLMLTFFVNTLSQFFMPSESSAIPVLVPKKQLFLANSLFSLTLYGSFMLGFTLAGPILNHFGINTMFALGALSLIVAFFMARNLPSIKITPNARKLAKLSPLKSFRVLLNLTVKESKETLEFVRGKLEVSTAILLMSGVQGLIGAMAVIIPAYMEKILLIHATDSSYIVILPLGLGMIFGVLVLGKWFHKFSRRGVVVPAILGAGIILFILGIMPIIAHLFQAADLPTYLTKPRYFFKAPSLSTLFAILAFLAGICAVSIIVPCQTVLQEHTTFKNRGKIFAVLIVVMTAFSAITAVLSGVLSDIFGVLPLLISLGVLIIGIGYLVIHPQSLFKEHWLPFSMKEFLGLEHWERVDVSQKSQVN
ncbi:MAG: MFS transporter [Candidatus Daviesbacteria bacterium]|nr:MFS transporter [Candidatus Daviesbacteria bacterium]